ncbi:hypothetical protein N0V85_006593 [Neurospora sp. IMI 360204]|nr:hypothetical protein N0V85_006593 [Neurospora sp. IMI 360204]
MSGNQDEETKPVYHSYHSYLFSKVIKRHPNLTTEELEKEFKTKVEGAYVTKLLKDYVAFCPIPSDQVDWSRAIWDRLEMNRNGRDRVE